MPHTTHKKVKIAIKRAYEDASPQDGYRVLVDRIWPRGRTKEELALGLWAKDLAPSTELRKWFEHDPKKWEKFQQRYRSELDTEEKQQQMRQLLTAAHGKPLTLVYGAKDEEHNQAVVLKEVLMQLS
ncbi:MAG TPA: DUF488 domain-containing protein [Burkholderiaceae bacterium]|jgi:uncharacterized protein YeaO (DUF488 family)